MKRFFMLLLACCICLAGCTGGLVFQDYREIDQVDLVQTLGIDREENGITVTASTSSAGGQLVLRNRSLTISRAIRELQNYTEKKYIFYGHTNHLLVGEAEAQQGLSRCLEFVERDSEVRLDTDLYIVRDGTAESAITLCSEGGSSIGDLLDSLNKDVQLMNESFVFSCGDTAEALEERGAALVAAVRLHQAEGLLYGGNEYSLESCGFAIVTKTGLLGYLDRNLARGANLLMNKTGSDVIEVCCGDTVLAARMTSGSSRYVPHFQDGELTELEIRITVRCNVDDLLPAEQRVDEETVLLLENGLARIQQVRVTETLRISQTMNADFCGLEQRVRQAAPLRFARMKQNWRECFSSLPITVVVQAKLDRTYDAGLKREDVL